MFFRDKYVYTGPLDSYMSEPNGDWSRIRYHTSVQTWTNVSYLSEIRLDVCFHVAYAVAGTVS